MRYRRWAKDYDCVINYYYGKVNVVADALNWKSTDLATLSIIQRPLHVEIWKFEYEMILKSLIRRLAILLLQPTLLKKIKEL